MMTLQQLKYVIAVAEAGSISEAAGVSPGLVRFSVGIEHVDDIIADIDSALASL